MLETPKVGCDTLILNENNEILLIQRSDNLCWAMPGGYHDLGESAKECALRECLEETGLNVIIESLLGVFSSLKYESTKSSINRNREICHILFLGRVVGGKIKTSVESKNIKWFSADHLPKLSDGHEKRIREGIKVIRLEALPFFE